MIVIAVVSGSVGAVLRYVVSGLVQETWSGDFPLGTLTVNVAGAFALGLLAGGGGDANSTTTIAATGFVGGFTTFSTWMVETIGLGPWSVRAMTNLALMFFAGVAAAAIGFMVA